MAIDPGTISNLYRRYLSRDATPGEIQKISSGQGRYGEFNTPDKLSGLLSSTSKSVKERALDTVNGNIARLSGGGQQTPQSLYGGKLPEFTQYEGQNPELRGAQGEYDIAQKEFGMLGEQAAAQPSRTRSMLKSGSYFFGEGYDDLRKKYSDPNSPWFIPNVESRNQIIDDALKQKNETMQDVVTKIGDIYSVLTTAAQNELAGKKDKVEAIRKSVEKSYDAMMAYYGQERSFEEQRKSAETEHKYRLEEIAATPRGGSGRSPAPGSIEEAATKGYTLRHNATVGGVDFLKNGIPVSPQEWEMGTGVSYLQALYEFGTTDPGDIQKLTDAGFYSSKTKIGPTEQPDESSQAFIDWLEGGGSSGG